MLTENPFNASSLAFPMLECFHIAGFICAVGTIALVDFRLLGFGLTQKNAAQLWRETTPWTLSGLALVIFTGLLLFSIDPDVYYLNRIFSWKMVFLVVAILFHFTAVHKTAASRGSPNRSRIVGGISLGLWAPVFFAGVFIGFH
jgi:hypothetical protein